VLQKELLHAGFGIAVMILTVVQVIMGLARPDGDAGRKRMAFNWMHLLTGSASYILAAVTSVQIHLRMQVGQLLVS